MYKKIVMGAMLFTAPQAVIAMEYSPKEINKNSRYKALIITNQFGAKMSISKNTPDAPQVKEVNVVPLGTVFRMRVNGSYAYAAAGFAAGLALSTELSSTTAVLVPISIIALFVGYQNYAQADQYLELGIG